MSLDGWLQVFVLRMFSVLTLFLMTPRVMCAVEVPVYLHEKPTNILLVISDESAGASPVLMKGELAKEHDETSSSVDKDVWEEFTKDLSSGNGKREISDSNVFIGPSVINTVRYIANAINRIAHQVDNGGTFRGQYQDVLPRKPKIRFSDSSSKLLSRFEGDIRLEPWRVDSEDLGLRLSDDDFVDGPGVFTRPGRIIVRMKVYEQEAVGEAAQQAGLPKAALEFIFELSAEAEQPAPFLGIHIFNPQVSLSIPMTIRYVGREIGWRLNASSLIGYPSYRQAINPSSESWFDSAIGSLTTDFRALVIGYAAGGLTYWAGVAGPVGALITTAAVAGATYHQQRKVRDNSALFLAIQGLIKYILSPDSQPLSISMHRLLTGNLRDRTYAVIRHRSTPMFDSEGVPHHEVLPNRLRQRKF